MQKLEDFQEENDSVLGEYESKYELENCSDNDDSLFSDEEDYSVQDLERSTPAIQTAGKTGVSNVMKSKLNQMNLPLLLPKSETPRSGRKQNSVEENKSDLVLLSPTQNDWAWTSQQFPEFNQMDQLDLIQEEEDSVYSR